MTFVQLAAVLWAPPTTAPGAWRRTLLFQSNLEWRAAQLSARSVGLQRQCMWAKPGDRSGLRIRGQRGHPVVRAAFVRFAGWLRNVYAFPVRVPVYLSPRERLVTIHGSIVTASFFAPWSPSVEPYIRIATGDYPVVRKALGRDDALAGYLHSLAHEIVHYQQWLATGSISERGVSIRAGNIVDRYASTVAHP